MVFSATTSLALHSVLWLCTQPEGTTVRAVELSRRFGYDVKVLTAVCQLLERGGLLHREGPRAGYRLTRPASGMRLLEIVELCQGAIPGNYCQSVHQEGLPRTCGLHQAMHELQQAIREVLGGWTLDRILTNAHNGSGGPACLLRRVTIPAEKEHHAPVSTS